MNNNNLFKYFAFIFVLFIGLSALTACDQRESSRELNPDTNPPVVDNDDDPISTPPDSDPTVGDDMPGGGGGSGGAGSGGNPPPTPPPDDTTPADTGTGEIRGTVESSTGIPLNGVHVRAVNINDTNIQVSSFSGIDTDLALVDGAFSIQFVPPGTYRVLIERMDSRNDFFDRINRYSDFVENEVTTLAFPDEYWNGTDESSSDNILENTTIVVTNGGIVNGVNFITNDGDSS